MSVIEDIKTVVFNNSSAVFHLYRLVVIIAWNYHFCAKSDIFRGCNESVAPVYFVAVGGSAVCKSAAAFSTGAVGSDLHSDGDPPFFMAGIL